ncbi:radical SAM/SPASM domain-containing protein [Paenibacillus beijingensis]|uniref:Radical SAM core domain-containing protein n=1 Tax=Paenibacillus beijingensis TaxID=1126833 RepID=A0A0D5NQB6_9BACL|nr:radical SAM protein [Paenibacillus beijingensis]AJY77370.1 hypothetical protein VN24_25950 [Paenibacillus beijingensis]
MHLGQNTVLLRVNLPKDLLGDGYYDESGKVAVASNPVTGAMDILSGEEAAALEAIRSDGDWENYDPSLIHNLHERGYIFDQHSAEQIAYNHVVDQYNEGIRTAPFQFMFIPSFLCNLACPYCFEGDLTKASPRMTKEMIDSAFDMIPTLQELHDNEGQPYITLFGGEPFLDIPAQREAVEYIMKNAYERNYPITAVTNGVQLDRYIPLLKKYEIREIQVSLDGPPEIHNQRRIFRGGKPTFHLIEKNIDEAIAAGLRVLVRVLVDKQTLGSYPAFAEYALQKGWLDHPRLSFFYGFTKHVGFLDVDPNHPAEHRHGHIDRDYTLDLLDDFYQMLRENPLVDRMLKPDPVRLRSPILEGDIVRPNLQGCSAGTSVLAFDPNGRIYGCPETVGRTHHAFGTYFPDFSYNRQYREPWRTRNVDSVPMCRDCNVKLFCGGGGCPIKAWAFNGGDFNSAYCPKVESVKAQLTKGLEYMIPLAFKDDPYTTEKREETEWDEMKKVGAFLWRS